MRIHLIGLTTLFVLVNSTLDCGSALSGCYSKNSKYPLEFVNPCDPMQRSCVFVTAKTTKSRLRQDLVEEMNKWRSKEYAFAIWLGRGAEAHALHSDDHSLLSDSVNISEIASYQVFRAVLPLV